MLERIAQGGTVSTNLRLKWPESKAFIEKRYGVIPLEKQFRLIDDGEAGEQTADFHRFTPAGSDELNSLVVIDEGHLTFNSRDWQKTDKLHRELLKFLSQSRKDNTDVIFISQDMANMDAQFMRLAMYLRTARDLNLWKVPGFGAVWPLPQFMLTTHDYTGAYQGMNLIWKDWKGIGSCYDTRQKLQAFERSDVCEKLELERVRKPSRMKYVWILVLIALFYLGGRLFLETREHGVGGAAFGGVVKPDAERDPTLGPLPVAGQPAEGQTVAEMTTEAGNKVEYVFNPEGTGQAGKVGRAWYAYEPLRMAGTRKGVPFMSSPWDTYRQGGTNEIGYCEYVDIPRKQVKLRMPNGEVLYLQFFREDKVIKRHEWERVHQAKKDGTWRRTPGPAEKSGLYGEVPQQAEIAAVQEPERVDSQVDSQDTEIVSDN